MNRLKQLFEEEEEEEGGHDRTQSQLEHKQRSQFYRLDSFETRPFDKNRFSALPKTLKAIDAKEFIIVVTGLGLVSSIFISR